MVGEVNNGCDALSARRNDYVLGVKIAMDEYLRSV